MSVISINDHPLASVHLHVPHRGPWWARVELVDAPELEGRVTIAIDELRLSGTVLPGRSGTHVGHRRALVFGGAAGWGTEMGPQHYQSDTGVRARLVAEDAARAAGETLGIFEPQAERLGPHYVLSAGLARRVLEDAIGHGLWWVDYQGVTHVAAERPTTESANDDCRVLDYDPLERVATLEILDPRAISVGSRLTGGLDEPQIVRELDLTASPAGLRMEVWTGAGRFGRADHQVWVAHRRYSERYLLGSWRYRVIAMNEYKLDARPVRRDRGLPELVAVELSPGIPGADVQLAEGTEVLVEFVEGDRALPRVVAFAGRDQDTWTPAVLTLDGTRINLGAGATNAVALANLVQDNLAHLKDAIMRATPTPNDGGLGFKKAILAGLTSFPGPLAATKVRAQ
jgi:hypothetical protein